MTVAIWKVYGLEGHRQRESFSNSYVFTDWEGVETAVINADITGTNNYTVVIFKANTYEDCERALWGQLSDGIFENSRTGRVELISKKIY